MNAPNVRARRGASMMLVLVALATSAVLTTTYLSSRDNSAVIGRNVGSTSSARWAAVSGVEMAIAILQTDSPWRTRHVGGLLIDDFAVGDAMVDVTIVDLATGDPPGEESRNIGITSVATNGSIRQTAQVTAQVGRAGGDAPDPDLSDFVIFGKDRIDLANDATVARWTASPLGDLGKRLALGTNAVDSGKVMMRDDSATIDGVLYHGPGASSTLMQITEGPAVDTVALPDQIPVPMPPDSGQPAPVGPSTNSDITMVGETLSMTGDEHIGNGVLADGELRLGDGTTLVVDEDFMITGTGRMVVEGKARLVVFGDLLLDTGQITVADNGGLDVYVGGQLDVHGGYVGNALEAGEAPDATGMASWMDPERLQVFDMSTSTATWMIDRNSVVKASVYAPGSSVIIADNAALYGRVAAKQVALGDDAAIFYDHSLDSGGGYTDETSTAFDESGRISDDLKNLSSLNEDEVAAAKDAIQTELDAGKTEGNEEIGPGATPRTVSIDVRWRSIGADATKWESAMVSGGS
jgi:hypothetical protein